MRYDPLLAALIVSAAISGAFPALAGQSLQNWFNDPFFQVTHADPECPVPAGPFVDAKGRQEQAHRRAEKGTTCWLAGECDRPKAYAYDQDIATAIQKAFAETSAFAASTLWVTVQDRVVYIEGCAPDDATAAQLESLVRALPHVQQAIGIVRTDPRLAPPYKRRDAR